MGRVEGVRGALMRAIAGALNAPRINAVAEVERGGVAGFEKRRRLWAGPLFAPGNLFLRLSRSRIYMFADVEAWRRWELHCFALLHGHEAAGVRVGRRGLWLPRLPGTPLRDLARRDEITATAMVAAANALRQAHARRCEIIGGPWSHGDPHLGNVLFDPASGRASLIDFETRHDPGLSAEERHADDLLILLLELIGRAPGGWEPLASALLRGYGQPAVLARLRARLSEPRAPLEALLWFARAHLDSPARLDEAVAALLALTRALEG